MELEEEIETVRSIFMDDLSVQASEETGIKSVLSFSMKGQPILALHLNGTPSAFCVFY